MYKNSSFKEGNAGEPIYFERLLSEVSAKYINMPIEEIEGIVRNDFGRLAGLLGGDSCNFHLFDQEAQDWLTLFDSAEKVFLWARREEFADQLRSFRSRPDFAEKMEYMFEQWDKGEYVTYPSSGKKSEKAEKMENYVSTSGVISFISVPIIAAGTKLGAIILARHERHSIRQKDIIPKENISKIRLFGEIFANALLRKRSEESLRNALSEVQRLLAEIKKLKEQVEADYLYLSEETKAEHNYGDIVGQSQALQRILVKVKQVAPTNAPVLLLGETGTGKGLIARSLHNASKHNSRPLVQVNCAALTPSLIESELFGHEKGAFTGASARRAGRFESAHGTTLFLDEIGELPLDLQPKLLRVLQDGEFERVGGTGTIKTDVRIIAATNRDLEKDVEEGRFRRDLWYRLSVFPIFVPPLRERLDDIPLFVEWFVDKYSKWSGKKFKLISQKTIKALKSYSWPGNIRELENLIERSVITSPEGNLQIEIPTPSGKIPDQGMTLQEMERAYLIEVLEKTSWVIQGPKGAAHQLGLNPSSLRFRMKKSGIKRPSHS